MENKQNPSEEIKIEALDTVEEVALVEHEQVCPQDSDCAEDGRGPHTNFLEELREKRGKQFKTEVMEHLTQAAASWDTQAQTPIADMQAMRDASKKGWSPDDPLGSPSFPPLPDYMKKVLAQARPSEFDKEYQGNRAVKQGSRSGRRTTHQIGAIVGQILLRDARIGVLCPTRERAFQMADAIINVLRDKTGIEFNRTRLVIDFPAFDSKVEFVVPPKKDPRRLDTQAGIQRMRALQWSASIVDAVYDFAPELIDELELRTRLGELPLLLQRDE